MTATVTKDQMSDVLRSIHQLVSQEVLVGIPQSKDARDDGGPIGNAEIGYIQETGSPANNLPARPFLVPGVQKALPKATRQLQKAASAALDGSFAAAEAALDAAGMIAANEVMARIGSNIPPALAPSTIRGRKYARGTKSRRPGEIEYLANVRGGMDPAAAQSAAGIVALVNTGELRNAITHVLRKAK